LFKQIQAFFTNEIIDNFMCRRLPSIVNPRDLVLSTKQFVGFSRKLFMGLFAKSCPASLISWKSVQSFVDMKNCVIFNFSWTFWVKFGKSYNAVEQI